jgi:hypothetical protein
MSSDFSKNPESGAERREPTLYGGEITPKEANVEENQDAGVDRAMHSTIAAGTHGEIFDAVSMAREVAMAQYNRDLEEVLFVEDEDARSVAFERLLKSTDAVYAANKALENLLASQGELLRATVAMAEPGHDPKDITKLGDQAALHMTAAAKRIDEVANHTAAGYLMPSYADYVKGVGFTPELHPITSFAAGLRGVANKARMHAKGIVERIRDAQAHLGSRVISRVAMGRKAISDLAASAGRAARNATDTAKDRARAVLARVLKLADSAQQMADKVTETVVNAAVETAQSVGDALREANATVQVNAQATKGVLTDAVRTMTESYKDHRSAAMRMRGMLEAPASTGQKTEMTWPTVESPETQDGLDTLQTMAQAVVHGLSGGLSGAASGGAIQKAVEVTQMIPTPVVGTKAGPVSDNRRAERAKVLTDMSFEYTAGKPQADGSTKVQWVLKDVYGNGETRGEQVVPPMMSPQDAAEEAAWSHTVRQACWLKFVDRNDVLPGDEAALVREARTEVAEGIAQMQDNAEHAARQRAN